MPAPFLMRPLSTWEKAALWSFGALMVAFGWLVEVKSAFLSRRMGDAGVFLRAAWSVKAGGGQLYQLSCDNDWHYVYPPLLAILLTPLADPPERDRPAAVAGGVGVAAVPGAGGLAGCTTLAAEMMLFRPEVGGGVPYAWSIAILYAANLLTLGLSVHLLAGALEGESRPHEVRHLGARHRRWWWLRLLPILACLTPIGHTLMRGQVNLLLLLLICGMMAALVRGRRCLAGLWLAGAICLKIIPAFLLLVPLVRRDLRCLAGCALGLAVGLLLVPAAVLGPRQALESYRELGDVLILPALGLGRDTSRAEELIQVTATDNQSFRAVLHNIQYPGRESRPADADPWAGWAHGLIGLTLTALTVLVSWRRRHENGPVLVVWTGALTVVMATASPVCHAHYFVLCLPLTMALLALAFEDERPARRTWAVLGLIALQFVGQGLSQIPLFKFWREMGLSLGTALGVWLAGCVCLVVGRWRKRALTEHRLPAAA